MERYQTHEIFKIHKIQKVYGIQIIWDTLNLPRKNDYRSNTGFKSIFFGELKTIVMLEIQKTMLDLVAVIKKNHE